KYFPEMIFPTIEQDLELFEKPPPIEPAATISSMGEVAAAVQEANLTQPPAEPAAENMPPAEQLVPSEPMAGTAPPMESPAPAPEPQPETKSQDAASQAAAPETQPEQPAASPSPMDMLAKLLRGESARPDGP